MDLLSIREMGKGRAREGERRGERRGERERRLKVCNMEYVIGDVGTYM